MQDTAPPFRSVDNLKVCIDVFQEYMVDKYAFNVKIRDPDHKATMYNLMLETAAHHPPSKKLGRREMNNLFLNAARDEYVRRYNIEKVTTPNEKVSSNKTRLTNDVALYENRKAIPPMARATAASSFVVSQSTPEAIDVRSTRVPDDRSDRSAMGTKRISEAPFKETAFDPREFEKKLFALRNSRDDGSGSDASVSRLLDDVDMRRLADTRDGGIAPSAKELYHSDTMVTARNTDDTSDNNTTKTTKTTKTTTSATSATSANSANSVVKSKSHDSANALDRSQFVAPPAPASYTSDRFLIVNGFDRDWGLYKHRFSVVADFSAISGNDLQHRYKNIRSIGMKRVIIPQEVCDGPSLSHPGKTVYNHPFSFSVPYVLITIDEIPSVFDGTNDTVRRSFCQMIVDKHYRAPNGRGFFVLQSMQDEKKTFYPAPLDGLTRMSIAVRKPNGELFNDSKDDYRVTGIQSDGLNPHYIMIVLDKFFDKNEFARGDTVRIRNFVTPDSSSASRRLVDFMNRDAGHAVAELGQPNTSGYYKTFYIRAPGVFDAERGVDATDTEIMKVVEMSDNGTIRGDIMNTTLQCVFSFKLETLHADLSAECSNSEIITA